MLPYNEARNRLDRVGEKNRCSFLLCLALFFSASNRCWLFFWCTRPNLFELDAIGTFESQECFSLLLLFGWLFALVWRWLLNNGGDSAEANGVKYYPDTLSHDVESTVTVRSIYHASDAAIHHRMWSNCLIWMCLSAYLPFPFQSTEMAFIRHILPSTLLLSHQAKSHFDSFPTLLHRINESIIQFYLDLRKTQLHNKCKCLGFQMMRKYEWYFDIKIWISVQYYQIIAKSSFYMVLNVWPILVNFLDIFINTQRMWNNEMLIPPWAEYALKHRWNSTQMDRSCSWAHIWL